MMIDQRARGYQDLPRVWWRCVWSWARTMIFIASSGCQRMRASSISMQQLAFYIHRCKKHGPTKYSRCLLQFYTTILTPACQKSWESKLPFWDEFDRKQKSSNHSPGDIGGCLKLEDVVCQTRSPILLSTYDATFVMSYTEGGMTDPIFSPWASYYWIVWPTVRFCQHFKWNKSLWERRGRYHKKTS